MPNIFMTSFSLPMALKNYYFFPKIDLTNNQSSVSNADRGIPALGSTDNAGNKVNIVSGIIRLSSGLDFASETDVRFYLRMYAPHVFRFLRRFCAAQGANARACTGYLSFHTFASEKR